MKQNKDVRLTIRLTPEQHESICSRAEVAQMTPSAFVRAAAMRHKVTVVPGLREATHELKAIGSNLNQLAILSHEGSKTIFVLFYMTAKFFFPLVEPRHFGTHGTAMLFPNIE